MIDDIDVEELAATICNLPDNVDFDEIDQALYDHFSIEFDDFYKIVSALVPLTVPAVTAISGSLCRGFVKDGSFIVKEYVDET